MAEVPDISKSHMVVGLLCTVVEPMCSVLCPTHCHTILDVKFVVMLIICCGLI